MHFSFSLRQNLLGSLRLNFAKKYNLNFKFFIIIKIRLFKVKDIKSSENQKHIQLLSDAAQLKTKVLIKSR